MLTRTQAEPLFASRLTATPPPLSSLQFAHAAVSSHTPRGSVFALASAPHGTLTQLSPDVASSNSPFTARPRRRKVHSTPPQRRRRRERGVRAAAAEAGGEEVEAGRGRGRRRRRRRRAAEAADGPARASGLLLSVRAGSAGVCRSPASRVMSRAGQAALIPASLSLLQCAAAAATRSLMRPVPSELGVGPFRARFSGAARPPRLRSRLRRAPQFPFSTQTPLFRLIAPHQTPSNLPPHPPHLTRGDSSICPRAQARPTSSTRGRFAPPAACGCACPRARRGRPMWLCGCFRCRAWASRGAIRCSTAA